MLGRTQRGRKGSNPLDLPNRLETDKITTLQNYKFNLSKNTRLKVSSLHTMNLGKDNEVTFDLWVVCKYQKGKRGKHGIEYLAYVVHRVTISLDYIYQDYRKRFGIESSYRLKNICRIRILKIR